MKTVLTLLGLAGVLTIAACGGARGDACEADGDCAAGLTCWATGSGCFSDDDDSAEWECERTCIFLSETGRYSE